MLTRKGLRPSKEKDELGVALLAWIENLPPELRMTRENGESKPYSFEIAQLHVPFLSAVTLVFSPRPIFGISPDNTTALVAATLTFRIYEAFRLRDQIPYLSPIFSWHLLVASVTRLSCLTVPSLKEDAEAALDMTESFFRELGLKWRSALNNLKNLQILRRDFNTSMSRLVSHGVAADRDVLLPIGSRLFKSFGSQATSYFARIEKLLRISYEEFSHSNNHLQSTAVPSQQLLHNDSATETEYVNGFSAQRGNEPSAVENRPAGADPLNPTRDSLIQLEDFFAKEYWMMEGMAENYPTDYFSPDFDIGLA